MGTYNTIFLRGDQYRYHDEKRANDTSVKPGYLLEELSTSKVKAHATRGGVNQRWFAKEDYLQGGNIDGAYGTGAQAATYYDTDQLVLIHKAQPGDHVHAVLQVGENITKGDYLVSYGNGKLCKAASTYLANAAAASTAVTNTTAETTFSNGSVVIPKNTLKVGDVIRIRAQGIATATNGTDTLNVKVKIGTDILAQTGAVDVANNDIFLIDVTLVIRTIGAAGTFVATGTTSIGASGTVTAKAVFLGSTAIDTTADQTITATATWSVANAGNSVREDIFLVEHVKAGTTVAGGGAGVGGIDIVGKAEESLDLSGAGADDHIEIEVM